MRQLKCDGECNTGNMPQGSGREANIAQDEAECFPYTAKPSSGKIFAVFCSTANVLQQLG